MPTPLDLTLDAWTGLSHKAAVSDPAYGASSPVPAWVGRSNTRRLIAYMVLWSYRKNAARYFLRSDPKNPDAYLSHREYGDPELLVQTIRAAVLGGDPRALVDGADDEPGKQPTREDIEQDQGEDVNVDELLAEAVAEWEADRKRVETATDRQEWLDQWWRDERADQKVIEGENNAVGLGDGVYELVNSTRKGRTRLRVHDPAVYFPVWPDDAQGDDFPDRVHLAWGFEDDEGDRFVRRITYELVRLDTARRFPYMSEGDKPSEWTCLKTDATWNVNDLGDLQRGVDLFDDSRAVYAVNEDGDEINGLDLELDFIPVVHVPNTPAIVELWGESALTRVAQILDDLAATDTDTAVAGALVAAPPIAMSGSTPINSTIETYGPGQIYRTGDGDMSVLDTSKSLDALLKLQAMLLERLSVNRQVPQSILGRVDLSGQLAGITLMLSFGPFRQYIDDLRLVRAEKYGLLLKFVQRMSISGGFDLQRPVLDANLALGSFLPTDQSAVKDMAIALYGAKIISRSTAMRMMQEAGVDIESIEDELDAVRRLDFEGAGLLADAVGDEQAARLYLGLPEPEQPPGGAETATEAVSQPPEQPVPEGEQAPPADENPQPLQ